MLDTTPSGVSTCLVFMPARNCEMFAAEAIRSLSRQTLDDVFVLYVDDASEDQTGEIAQHYLTELFPGRHTYIRNASPFGKSRNIWEHLRPRAADAEFIAILDSDDQLVDVSILQAMAKNYATGKDAVWTNYVTDDGRKGSNAALNPAQSPRVQRWCTSHFFSFRAALLENVPESYYKDSAGSWYSGACDVALALPILDQTRNYKFIPAFAYRYTTSNPQSLHNKEQKYNRVTSKLQFSNAKEIYAKPSLPIAGQNEDQTVTTAISAPMPTTSSAPSADHVWSDQAAGLLTSRYPALLTARSMTNGPSLSPLQLWSLSTILQRQPGNLLYIGTPHTAVVLAAMIAELPETSLTCLVDATEDAQVLTSQLALAGLSGMAQVVAGAKADIEMDGKQCRFPSCAALADTSAFSTVIVDPREEADQETYSVIALPAVSDYLADDGFHFCTLTSDINTARAVVEKVAKLTVGLNFCLGGIGGSGFVTFPALKE